MIRRLAAVAGLLVGLLVWLQIVQWFSGLPEGFNEAQSSTATDLAAMDGGATRWSELHDGANRDLGRFLPGYGVGGAVAVLAVFVGRGRAHRDRWLAAASVGLLAVGCTADLVETALFRSSLERLLDGGAAADLVTRTRVTRAFTAVKWAGVVGWLASLLWLTARPNRG